MIYSEVVCEKRFAKTLGGSQLTPGVIKAFNVGKNSALSSNAGITELQRILTKIDRAVKGLDADARRVIIMHYLERRSWREIADEIYCSADWTRKRRKEAANDMAFMIFGQKACPDQLAFCFCG